MVFRITTRPATAHPQKIIVDTRSAAEDLPREIADQIIDHLDVHDAVALAQVNKEWHACTEGRGMGLGDALLQKAVSQRRAASKEQVPVGSVLHALAQIPEAKSRMAGAQSLSFRRMNVGIDDVKVIVRYCPLLQRLDLEDNYLGALDGALCGVLCGLGELRWLNLRHNDISSVAPELKNLRALRELYINSHDLKTLPSVLTELPNLQTYGCDDLLQLRRRGEEMDRLRPLERPHQLPDERRSR